ncbi:DUF4011 domain-containing protein [Actinoplanes sp. Pm04-4]|uniref:DUF4011 domain-containing protein n=1 Tax=Paractinoplanes pyxinae TaxID=2997416 RepID=A0ABT4AZJ6_9ACTN|nr:DUF4011 domain-containing protein [Actinoplanes pyxinae]MCY1139655.1 DUF4011 domain-containing protein [Actinoplanes pyxinae]
MGAETPRAAVRAWRDGLVNLDAGNRLLNYRASAAGSLTIVGPATPDLVAALNEDRAYGFLPAGAKPAPGCLLRTGLGPLPLGTTLRRLLGKSRQDFLDRGVGTLYLAVGALHWRDEEETSYTSPVLLLPVELVARAPGEVPALRSRDDEPVVNPALTLRLRRMGITVPGLGSGPLDVRAYLAALRATVDNRDWRADESVVLSCFSFHKEAMYRDLSDNESRIVGHPLVAALAGHGVAELGGAGFGTGGPSAPSESGARSGAGFGTGALSATAEAGGLAVRSSRAGAGDPGAAGRDVSEVGTDGGGAACGQRDDGVSSGVKSATTSPSLSGRVVFSAPVVSSAPGSAPVVSGAPGSAPVVSGAPGSAPVVSGAPGSARIVSRAGDELPLVLDADATQRACVEAAVAGRSFVLDGPPGTGKSQTIANMIGCLMHAGKRVLFVSEKAAALEVVRNRLAAVGLDPYLLELHSHKATRREVARALAESVEPLPREGATTRIGVALGGAASASGGTPLGGAALTSGGTPLGGAALTSGGTRLGDAASASDGTAHGGTGGSEPGPVAATGVDRERLEEVRARLDGYARAMNERREPLGKSLHEVLGECARLSDSPAAPMPTVDPGQFDAEQLRRMLDAADELARCRRAAAEDFPWRDVVETRPLGDTLREAQAALRAFEAALEPYERIAATYELSLPADVGALVTLVTHAAKRPAPVPDEWLGAEGPVLLDRAAEQHRWFEDAARQVRVAAGVEWHELPEVEPPALDQATLTAAGAESAVRRHSTEAATLDDLLREVGPLAARLGLPDATTFGGLAGFAAVAELAGRANRPEPFWFSPGVLAGVAEAAAVLRRCADAVTATGLECRRWFLDAIVDQPVEQLADRLTNEHRGLRKLLPAYRRDWDAVAAYALPSVAPADAVAHLGTAVAWQRALRERALAERRYAPLLGRYRRGGVEVDDALRTAADLVRLSPPDALPALADQIGRPAPDPALVRLATQARIVAGWEPPTETLIQAAARRRALVGPLTEAAAALTAFDRALGRHIDLAEATRLDGLRRAAAGHATAYDARAIAWAREARRLYQGKPLLDGDADALAECVAAWHSVRDELSAAGLGEIDGDRLARLLDDPHGQDEWLGFQHARGLLAEETIAFCLELPSDQIRPVVERALWTAWADAVLRDDDRLRPVDGLEHDRLVDEFRILDAALMSEAPATISAAVESRRTAVPEEIALLRREGRKQSRHLPVRDLIGQARATVQSAKPCFLMSPLAVSQYLPPDLRFDVVIFDEASQVAPADAINCVYRADALIAAGDDRQLPPSTFFSTRADRDEGTDVNDFQSVLELAEACGAFPALGLGWHYRSRHEALIAFANHRFYQGRLLTFPGANADPETGVELIPAAGTYRRGGARDNPVEAEAVAARIIACLTTRPELSLGVVTFSVAQAEAIEAAVERAAARHPGLDRFLEGDRLTGFFVKSLESVQGDERDVMIFSIGYGRDEHGRVSTNFGALNQPNGWRRLNVAITRARRRVEIISSIRSRDIPESANPGVRHLAAYLEYAERGLASTPATTPPDPFVQSVLDTVRSWGYDADSHVGSYGYRLDIGVRHPTPGHGYVLGVECDGPPYGSIGSARDRDRLGPAVLAGLGWRLHRVWGTAWHHDRVAEEDRLREAIKAAVGPLPARRPGLLRLQPVG